MSGLGRVVAVVPVRSLAGAKSRLGEPLDPEEREALVLGLLSRTVAAATGAQHVERVVVVSGDEALLALARSAGAIPLPQRTDGLNEALDEAREWLCGEAGTILVLPVDLPRITSAEVDAVVAAAAASADPARPLVALVPDRHGIGTNVLLVSPPNAIPFRFGEGSRRRHEEEATMAGATFVELDGPLAFDVDTPDDLLLADLSGLGHEAGR